MGIYLSQLPPAELARLKAELAETIIANFCYPRFFDYRSGSLRMRPVDRSKRQEVWLYLSSVDFTTWSRVDLMSPDFQRQVERLFIQFVQRNRSFFGDQGRKRMSDIRMLISSTSTTVAQSLRNHLTVQRQGQGQEGQPGSKSTSTFGNPWSPLSWSISEASKHADMGWEHIAASTMLLQQQLQEVRGESKASSPNDGRQAQVNEMTHRTTRTRVESVEQDVQQTSSKKGTAQRNGRTTPTTPVQGAKSTFPLKPSSPPNPAPSRTQAPAASAASVQKQEVVVSPVKPMETPIVATSLPTMKAIGPIGLPLPAEAVQLSTPTAPVAIVQPRHLSQSLASSSSATGISVIAGKRENPLLRVGEDDIAIFEQIRQQMLVWLRVEAVRLGLDITNQGPSQLLELLHQQERFDETRLQVVSTLLNLANQVLKNGLVSVLDYKQALMFHLMHTQHTQR